MSLDDQALNRLRSRVKSPPALAAASVVDAAAEAGKSPKRLIVDIAALRAAGCIAEESEGRQFAAQYHEIKRPLIEAALSGKGDQSMREPGLIMVTSALPGDGKTFTSINLALSMARERDVSVLLVDADVLKSDVSALFGLKSAPGLLDALADESLDVESLIRRTNLPGLSLLPSGTPSESAPELMSSRRMLHIAGSLIASQPRRIVLFDSAPLLVTSEARSIAKIAGQAVLVIRADKTPRRAVEDAVKCFDERQIVGLVLNQVKLGLTKGYYGYGYYGFDYGGRTR